MYIIYLSVFFAVSVSGHQKKVVFLPQWITCREVLLAISVEAEVII